MNNELVIDLLISRMTKIYQIDNSKPSFMDEDLERSGSEK
jgi:hypothetical protein